MSKEERYLYHCDEYDYIETIYDNKECEECDSIRMATNWLNRLNNKISDLEAKLTESDIRNKESEIFYKREINRRDTKLRNIKQQLADTEAQNKRVLEKLDLIVRSNQELEQKLAEKEKDKTDFSIEQLEEKKEKLYFELLFTRLEWIHKKADECREEKERFGGIEDMALDSVWRVLDLQKHECCEYEEMVELEEGIKTIAEDKLLRDIEHDLGVKVTRTENEIFNDIELIENQIKQLKEQQK